MGTNIKTSIFIFLILLFSSCSFSYAGKVAESTSDLIGLQVEVVPDSGITIFYPHFSRIDLLCDSLASVSDSSVIFACAAAFTGTDHTKGSHWLIAQNHVCTGIKYNGYRCPRCNGAFVWYGNSYYFLKDDYAVSMDSAALNGGMAFAQECMIFKGEKVKTTRSLDNVHKYRALCSYNERLCIIQSDNEIKFGDFIDRMYAIGVSDALYLDMGGWDYGFCHPVCDSVLYLTESRWTDGFSNMIVFYQ